MLREYFWLQPLARNFAASTQRLRQWRRFAKCHPDLGTLLNRIDSERARIASEAIGDERNLYWLLPYRAELRQIHIASNPLCHSGQADAIRYYMAYCPPEMIPICVWLIGKSADRFRLYGISEFCRDPSPQVRKHVAKALRRLEAWSLLEEMATLYPEDAKVQWFATARVTHRPFTERLSNYVQSVDDSHADEVATPSRMSFWALNTTWDYTPPKSVQLIRRMLRRIRHWVRWGVS